MRLPESYHRGNDGSLMSVNRVAIDLMDHERLHYHPNSSFEISLDTSEMDDHIVGLDPRSKRPARDVAIVISALCALLFGVLSVFSGGQALFGGETAREAVGAVVPFVLWFNFSAGLAYVIAGLGLLLRTRWAIWLSILIAVSTLSVFLALGVHIGLGGAYEMRTVGAMVIRSVFWIVIAALAWRSLRSVRARSDPLRHQL